MVPVNSAQEVKTGDLVYFAVSAERREESEEWLQQQGRRPSPRQSTRGPVRVGPGCGHWKRGRNPLE